MWSHTKFIKKKKKQISYKRNKEESHSNQSFWKSFNWQYPRKQKKKKKLIYSSWLSLKIPPQIAKSRMCLEAPSILTFIQPTSRKQQKNLHRRQNLSNSNANTKLFKNRKFWNVIRHMLSISVTQDLNTIFNNM